jgi:nucleoside phosphorylase
MPIPTIVFLTALPLEYDAVIAHLPDGQIETRHNGGATYYVSEYVTPAKLRWQVAVRKLSAMGNYEAAQESIDAISDFFPSYMFFVGVAGGIKDVQLGDVVASSMARGYESVKVEETVIKQRAHVEYPSRQLVELAFQIASQSQWRSKIKLPEGEPKAQVCPIASGEKVITSPEFLKQLLQCCSDAVAVEMEAIGFLRTFRKRSQVQGIVIRGISDLVKDKNETQDKKWQPIAARHAAGFAWAMVEELPIPTVIPQEPPPQNLLHQYWDVLEPELQDAFALSYNQVRREGSNIIKTSHLFAALRKIGSESLCGLLEFLPNQSLPAPIEENNTAKEYILQEQPNFSPCVEDSLKHIGQRATSNRKLSAEDVFVDIAKYGTGSSVAQLRTHGISAQKIDQIVKQLGWNVIER